MRFFVQTDHANLQWMETSLEEKNHVCIPLGWFQSTVDSHDLYGQETASLSSNFIT